MNLPANTLNAGMPVEVGITPQTTAALTVPLLAVIRNVNAAASSGDTVIEAAQAVRTQPVEG
ncbi:hypothetical protein [Marinobacter gelidimuriae]|uniref:hypothetical protein n=1 Tax=Marinobacter gelidimuriae TaxID=2739064 RepID=UPI00047720B0|nr:hypothetical protein [Marinobacter gelidimuriae]